MSFYLSPMQEESFKIRIEKDQTFKRCFTKDLTKAFHEELKQRANSKIENHVVIVVFGQTGSGKTSDAWGIASIYDPYFDADSICFTTDKIIEKVEQHKGKHLYMRDETPKKFGSGSYREEARLATIAQTMRKAQLSLILIRPEFMYFPGAHFYVEALQMGENYENRLGIYDPDLRAYLGFVRIKVPKQTDKEWLRYQQAKIEFLEKVKGDDFGVLDVQNIAKKMLEDESIEEYKGLKQLKIFVKTKARNLTSGEVDEITTELHRLLKIRHASQEQQEEEQEEL